MSDDDGSLHGQVLMGLGALLVAALVIGAIISGVALTAARFAGVGSDAAATAAPTMYMPPEAIPTGDPTGDPQSVPESRQPNKGDSAKTHHRARNQRQISLSASPKGASTNERIYLVGTYRGGNGATLQVQRFDRGWVDFPVSATVRDGSFSTWVITGQGGRNRFRVVDESTGRASAPVAVMLR